MPVPLFPKNSWLGLRTFIFVCLAVACMMGDDRWQSFIKIRSVLSVVITPVQYLVNMPIEFSAWLDDYLTMQHNLLKENDELRANQLLLEAKVQRFIALEKENARLRGLLSSAAHVDGQVLVAQILAVNANPFDQQVVLDKGKRHGVYIGQPVLDASGVVGQVIAVGLFTSRVLLITSSRSAVPIQDIRSGIRAVAIGDGYSGNLHLMYVPDTVDIRVGDLLMTSGLGLKFSAGYPVGIVTDVTYPTDQSFAKIIVTPNAELNRSRQVLLIWPTQSKLAKNVRQILRKS
jgi:rod shape-determining protein MreC